MATIDIYYKIDSGVLYLRNDSYAGYTLFNCPNDSGNDRPAFPWQNNSNINIINIENLITLPKSCYRLFSTMRELVTINNIERLNTTNVINMGDMFSYCFKLQSLNLSNFYTSNVTNMSEMLLYCQSLTSLDLSNFDTSNVTDMSHMFRGCSSLISDGDENILDLSNFDTSNVTDMSYMFYDCDELISLDLSSFDTSNVTDMADMFQGCDSLTTLVLSSNFDTSNVTDMSAMFAFCKSLASLNVSNFDTSNVTNMRNMFYNCESLTSLDISNFDTSNVTNMYSMFSDCKSLTSLDVSNFDFSNVTDMRHMFYYCNELTSLTLPLNFDARKVTEMDAMFYNCKSLESLDLSNLDTSPIITPTSISTPKLYSTEQMFFGCESLTQLTFSSNFNTSMVTGMRGMFEGCSSLITLDLSDFDTNSNTTIHNMFKNCSSLTNLILSSKFKTSHISDMSYMFQNCNSLESLDLSSFNTSKVSKMVHMFSGCESLTSLDLSNFDFSKVSDMRYMFNGCHSLSNILTINSNSTAGCSFIGMFDNTSPAIIPIIGTSIRLQEIAAQWNNVYVYFPLNISYQKAERIDDDLTNALIEINLNRFCGENGEIKNFEVNVDSSLVSSIWHKYILPQSTEYSGNPYSKGWYELENGSFIPTSDTTINQSKKYYTDSNNLTMEFATETFAAIVDVSNENKTYEIQIRAEDDYDWSAPITFTIPTSYYTIDFLSGGKEISFGEKAVESDLNKYKLLDIEPLDWSTNWTDYYKIVSNEYVNVDDISAPTFTTNTYYKKIDSLFKCKMETEFGKDVSMAEDLLIDGKLNVNGVVTINNNSSLDKLTITNDTANTVTFIKTIRTDTNKDVHFGIGSGGQNRGIYLEDINKWLIKENGNSATIDLPVTINGVVTASGNLTVDGKIFVNGGDVDAKLDWNGSTTGVDKWRSFIVYSNASPRHQIGQITVSRRADNFTETYISVRNPKLANPASYVNSLGVRVYDDATLGYYVGAPAAFRSAIGAQATLSVSSSINIASYIASSTGTFVSGNLRTYGKIAHLRLVFKNSGTIAKNGVVYAATISSYKPVQQVLGVGSNGGNAVVCSIDGSGNISARNCGASASFTDTAVTFTYIMP